MFSEKLAEICGIHAGDGHLRKNKKEFEISGSFEEKEYYDKRVIPLFNKVFRTNIKGRFFVSKGTYGFYTSNKEILDVLIQNGFPNGKKKTIVRTPENILNSKNNSIKKAFLRGLFDTDGCINFDRKIGNSNPFKKTRHFYPRLSFVTVSEKLAKDIKNITKNQGFNFKERMYISKKENENAKYILEAYGKEALLKWIKEISPKNPTKYSRFLIWKVYGFCPTYTTYPQRLKILKGSLNPNSFYGSVA